MVGTLGRVRVWGELGEVVDLFPSTFLFEEEDLFSDCKRGGRGELA